MTPDKSPLEELAEIEREMREATSGAGSCALHGDVWCSCGPNLRGGPKKDARHAAWAARLAAARGAIEEERDRFRSKVSELTARRTHGPGYGPPKW